MKPDLMGVLIVAMFLAILIGQHILKTKATQGQYYPFKAWGWQSLPADWEKRRRQYAVWGIVFALLAVVMTIWGARTGGVNPVVIVAYFLAATHIWNYFRIGREARKSAGTGG